ncbi:hypothetical protein DM01DRAFT_1337944 [Hesseltinella vesiculosa]|uniref:Uncharacterized protein n=1 Tax=Hesseltinella vesiculosa TaxID=101127 RepID=A0A1X2GB64_9FUNG|nr:hypothetical protein DM01DRAFT_1337944 [Hesseltinella vesiculosa]
MLRVQGILQLEPLWLRPTIPTLPADSSIPNYQTLVQEPESYIVEEEEALPEQEEVVPGYQEIIEDHEIHTTSVTKIKEEEVVLLMEDDDDDMDKQEISQEDEDLQEAKEPFTPLKTSTEQDDLPTRNDSSLSISSSNQPPTPTSTTSTGPFRRLRRDSKFNERRKSVTSKLKRAFSANTTTSKRNSIVIN